MNIRLAIVLLLCGLTGVEAAVTNYVDNFNDTGAEEHNWTYWGEPTGGGPIQDYEVVWMANGGESWSARVTIDMENLRESVSAYWPLYLNSPDVGGLRDPDQELDFNNHTVSAIFNSHNISDPFNGGSLYFFLGQYIDGGDSAWYYFDEAFVVNQAQDDWSQATSIDITDDESDWTLLGGSASVPVTNLYNNPQQYGFVIVGAGSQPTYNLSMDNFSAIQTIPEPGVFALLAAGLTVFHLHRRRR